MKMKMSLKFIYKAIEQDCDRYHRMKSYPDTPPENINFIISCIRSYSNIYRNAGGKRDLNKLLNQIEI